MTHKLYIVRIDNDTLATDLFLAEIESEYLQQTMATDTDYRGSHYVRYLFATEAEREQYPYNEYSDDIVQELKGIKITTINKWHASKDADDKIVCFVNKKVNN